MDIARWGADWPTVARLPYLFDIIDYESLNTLALKEPIDRVGIEIYHR